MAISRRTFLKAGVGVGAVGVGYRQINKTKTQANIVIVGGGGSGRYWYCQSIGTLFGRRNDHRDRTTWFPLVSTGPNVITCRCLYTSQ